MSASTLPDVDFVRDPVPGPALHHLLAAARERDGLTEVPVVLERLPNLLLVEASEPAGAVQRPADRLRIAWDPA